MTKTLGGGERDILILPSIFKGWGERGWKAGQTDPLPSDGRGDSDWMNVVICEWVVRDIVSSSSEIGSLAECAQRGWRLVF